MQQNFEYTIKENSIYIEAYKGKEGTLFVPESIEGYPVQTIGKKAFLGNRMLRNVYLPKTVCVAEDWAFSHCINLRRIEFANENVVLQKNVLMGCNALERIKYGGANNDALLAVAYGILSDNDLLRKESATWYEMLDEKTEHFLSINDADGFEGLWTFGEEDYSEQKFDKNLFCRERRMKKCELVFHRLIKSDYLTEERKQNYMDYLKCRTVGCETEEAFLIIEETYKNEPDFYRTLIAAGGITDANRLTILSRMQNFSPEVRSLVMESKGSLKGNTFFDDLLSGL